MADTHINPDQQRRGADLVGGWVFPDADGDIHLLGCDGRNLWNKTILVPEDDLGYFSNCGNEDCPLGQDHPNYLATAWESSEPEGCFLDFHSLWKDDTDWQCVGPVPQGVEMRFVQGEFGLEVDLTRLEERLHPMYCKFRSSQEFLKWRESLNDCLVENIWTRPENDAHVGTFRIYSMSNCPEPPFTLDALNAETKNRA